MPQIPLALSLHIISLGTINTPFGHLEATKEAAGWLQPTFKQACERRSNYEKTVELW
jgi:hypothetical protein